MYVKIKTATLVTIAMLLPLVDDDRGGNETQIQVKLKKDQRTSEREKAGRA